ncbi:MAG: TIGR02147 family protein, partial [Bacteriovoracaceae bacterium]
MEAQLYLQKTIREKLDELQSKNNQFSLRAFARLLEVSPASLSEFLNGKRNLSPKMLKKLAEKLCLGPEDLNVLNEKIVREKKGLNHKSNGSKKNVQLQNDQYYLVADWHYYAILCLAETPEFKEDCEWISKRLKTSAPKVKEAMERLIRLGFLTYDAKGKL